nr:SDR family oxidoreductase [Sphaerisporangium rufum]
MDGMNRNDLTGKVALVTGGSRGIGAAVAVRLAEDGADVAFTYRQDAERAGAVADRIKLAGRRALAIQADSVDAAAVAGAVDRAAAEFGRLDILVNNAAVYLPGPVEQVTFAEVDATLAVNVRAPFAAAQAALKHLAEGGRIINIGSNVSERVPFPGLALYSMSKSALTGLTRALAREVGPRGITVNVVAPGPTDTDANPAGGPFAETISGITALGRYAAPEEIAEAVGYLAGDGARYITGATLHVDGGFTA